MTTSENRGLTAPTFDTTRLHLRPATAADLGYLQALWDEPEVRRYLFDDQPVTEAVAAEALGDCLSRTEMGLGLWIVATRPQGIVVGCVGLNPTAVVAEYEPALAGLLEPIAALAPLHQGQGYATEALRALVDHAFTTLAVAKLAAVNDAPNQASARMLARLGFVPLSEVPGPRHVLQTYTLVAPG